MIYLVRHTKPAVKSGTCYGWTDLDVDTSFNEELKIIKEKTGNIDNFKFHSSPLIRCSKLAAALANENTINFDERLKELSFGKWEGLEWDKIPEDEMKVWGTDFINNTVPEGESYQEMLVRVKEFWDTVNINEDTVIVAHDGVLRAILYFLLEMKKENVFRINLEYGAVIKISPWMNDHCKISFL